MATLELALVNVVEAEAALRFLEQRGKRMILVNTRPGASISANTYMLWYRISIDFMAVSVLDQANDRRVIASWRLQVTAVKFEHFQVLVQIQQKHFLRRDSTSTMQCPVIVQELGDRFRKMSLVHVLRS